MNGVMVSRMARIIVPLIMLPNRRAASAKVRDSSLTILKGSMIAVGFTYSFRYSPSPHSPMPNIGTAMNTQIASAVVVDKEPVGGS